MKYSFEVTCHENENTIKVEIGLGSPYNSVAKIITFKPGFNNEIPNLNELVSDLIDNIRLTVKEREEAIYNSKVFMNYVQQYNINQNKDSKEMIQMITENGDPSVLGDPDKYIK